MHRSLTLSLMIALAAGPVAAEVYRWVDDNGVVHYSDTPKAGTAERADLPSLQPVAQPPEEPAAEDTDSSEQQATGSLVLQSPRHQQTFRDADGTVLAQVSVSPSLGRGQQLVYYLDGSPVDDSPTQSTQLQLRGVARGEHTLSVALTNGSNELARTDPVTFYMRQPSALNPTDQDSALPPDQPTGAQTAPPANRTRSAPGAPAFNPQTPANN